MICLLFIVLALFGGAIVGFFTAAILAAAARADQLSKEFNND